MLSGGTRYTQVPLQYPNLWFGWVRNFTGLTTTTNLAESQRKVLISHSTLGSSFPHMQILEFYLNLSDRRAPCWMQISFCPKTKALLHGYLRLIHMINPLFLWQLYLSSVKLMKKQAKLGVVYTQNKIGIFSETICEIKAPLWEYDWQKLPSRKLALFAAR